MEFSRSTKDSLGYYVYALVEPDSRSIFYVGKASSNNRAFDHLKSSKAETAKHKKIAEIRAEGNEPLIEILRYGLSSEEMAFEVEAAIIDAIGLENLTNEVRGHGIERGRMLACELERLYGAEPILIGDIQEPCMLFFIQNTFSPTLSEQELYDCTRQFWHDVSEQKRLELTHRIALAIVDSVVVRVYAIAGWYQAGTTLSSRTPIKTEDKWEFVGNLLDDHPLAGKKLVEDDGRTPIAALQKGFTYLPRV